MGVAKKYTKGHALLLTLCFLLILSGCGREATETTDTVKITETTDIAETTDTTEITEMREPVKLLECIQPSALNSLCPASGAQVAVNLADYENECTTVLLVDVNRDVVSQEILLDGVWDLKEQAFSDGKFALCQRETNTWKFLSASLEDLGEWNAENVDGFFSYDGSTYYYLSDHVLFWKSVSSGESGKVKLPYDLRLLELTAFDAQSGTLAMHFFLSPYSSECGTAVFDMKTGTFTMLQTDRYRVFFRGDDICLLSFDNEMMSYSVTYGGGDQFLFADASIFSDTVGDLYTISDSPYLMGITTGHSILYTADWQITSCPLEDCGIDGEMYSVCYLPDEEVLTGAVYQNGAFRFYVIDPAQISFTETASAVPAVSPFVVDDALVEAYWGAVSGAPVAESLLEAQQYADTLEEKYGVRILMSSQCKDPAALCDKAFTLTDTMSADEELNSVCTMLEALERSLALYPKGFPAQFQNGAGDGGLCFLLVEHIESDYGVVGYTYESYEWQYIALDVCQTYNLDSIICHEIWHAMENHILSCDYTALSMDEWDTQNPEGFAYYGDATQTDPAQPWTLYTCRPEDIHFVDSYACVDRHEDRARIMEYFMVHEDEAKLLIQSPFIRRKLQMMCDAVRSAFDTTGWENVRWERLL
ncbi:MAG: hypothetical protein ACI4EG_08345 [Fusicatenibacter sp.]|nr:hypothetical protein [Fusicatenibacter sp.]